MSHPLESDGVEVAGEDQRWSVRRTETRDETCASRRGITQLGREPPALDDLGQVLCDGGFTGRPGHQRRIARIDSDQRLGERNRVSARNYLRLPFFAADFFAAGLADFFAAGFFGAAFLGAGFLTAFFGAGFFTAFFTAGFECAFAAGAFAAGFDAGAFFAAACAWVGECEVCAA